MECPSDVVLNTIKYTLEREEVNQVGSFVWSHLTNLMETSNPLKQDIRSILEDESLKKDFNMDSRKFSRNYEWSFFLEKLNTGASVESNMIWSSKSFIPRSLMANLTVDLFGQSVNLLEIGGRIEGLEYFMETYFGPNGYFAEKTVKEATKQVVKGIDARKMKNIDRQVCDHIMQMCIWIKEEKTRNLYNKQIKPYILIANKTLYIGTQRTYTFEQFRTSKASLKSEVKGENRKSDLTIEYLPSKFIKLESSIRPNLQDLEGIIKISTHSDKIPQLSAHLRHTGDMSAFVSRGELEYSTGKKIEADVSFSNAKKIDGSLSFKSPFTKDVSAVVSHEGPLENMKSSARMQYGKSRIFDTRTTYKQYPYPEGSISLRTPYTDDISAAFKHGMGQNQMSSHGEIQFGAAKKYEADVTYQNLDKVQSTVSIKSPHHKDITVMVNVGGTLQNFNSHIDGRYGKSKYEGVLSFSNTDKLQSSISIKSPHHEDIAAKINHAGSLKRFSSHAEAAYGSQKYESDVSFNTGKKLEGSLTLKSPKRKDIVASFSHEGSLKKFKTSGSLQLTAKAKFNTDITFTKAKRTLGTFSFKSPMMSNIDAQFKHSGSLKDMNTVVDVKVNKVKKIGLVVGIASKKRFLGTMKLETPFMDAVNVKVVHKGRSTNFKLSTDVAVGKNKYSTDVTFKAKPNIKVTVSTSTPLKGLKKVKADLTHSGSARSFKSQASLGIGKEKYSGNLKFTLKPNLIAEAIFETPLKGLKKIGAKVTHEGRLDNFKCHAEVTKGKSKEFNGDLVFAISPKLSAFVSVQTPFKRFENNELSFVHEGTIRNFQSKAKLVGLRGKTIAITAKADTENDISADLSLQTPFKGFELFSGSISKSGTWDDFIAHAEVDNGSPSKYIADAQLSLKRKIEGSASIRTPIVGLEMMKAVVSHDGTANNFRSHVEVEYKKKKSEADVTFTSIGKIEGSTIIKSPYIKPIKASLTAKSSPIVGKMSASYGKRQLIDGHVKLLTGKGVKGSATFKTWFAPDVKATISQEGNMKAFRVQSEASYGSKKVQSDTSFSSKNDITASTTLITPFNGYEKSSASFSFSGTMKNLRSRADCVINGKTIEADVTFSADGPITGSAALHTPMTSLRELVGSFRHSGKATDFASHGEISLNGEKAESDITFDIDGQINIRASLKHPSIQDVILMVSHDGDFKQFNSHAELTYQGIKQVNSDISLMTNPSIEFSGKLDANCPAIQNVEATFTHKGPQKNFRSAASFSLNGQKTEGKVTHDSRNGIKSRIVLKTPKSEDIVLSLEHIGDRSNFKSAGKLEYSGKKQYLAKVALNTLSAIDGKMTLETPIRKYSAALNHEGTLKSFKTSSHLEYDTDKRIQLNVNYDDLTSGQLTLTAPFMSDIYGDFSHNGDISNFKSSGTIKYDDKEIVWGQISFETSPTLKGNVILRTQDHNGRITFTHDGSMPNIDSSAEVIINDVSMVRVDIKTAKDNGYTGTWTLQTPIVHARKTTVSYRHSLTSDSLDNHIEIIFGGNKKVESDLEASFVSPYKGSLTIRTPYKKIEKSHASFVTSVSDSGFQSHAEGSIFRKKMAADVSFDNQKPMQGSVIITTPFTGYEEMKASFSHDASRRGLTSHAEAALKKKTVSVDLRYDSSNDIEASLNLKTPFKNLRQQSISLRHADRYSQIEGIFQGEKIEASLERKTNYVKVSIKTPFTGFEQQEASYNYDGKVRHIEGIFRGKKMESDLSFEPSNAALIIKTPFTGFENQHLAYNFDGTTGHAEGEFRGKKVEIDILATRSRVTLKVQTPFEGFEEQNIAVNFDGTTGHAEGTFRGQKVELDLYFEPSRMTLEAKTPFEGFERQSLAYTVDDTTAHAESTFRGKKAELDLYFVPSKMTLELKTPFNGFEIQNVAYTVNGNNVHAEGIFRGQKIELDILLEKSRMTLEIKTPFKGFEVQNLAYNLNDKSGHAEGTFRGKKAELDISFQPADMRLEVKTPFKGYKKQHLAYNFDGTTGHAEGKFRGQKVELDLSIEPSRIEITAKSPFKGYEKQNVLYNYDGMTRHIEGTFQRQTVEADLSIEPSKIDLSVKTPFTGFEEQELSVSHRLTSASCDCKIEGTFRGQKIDGMMTLSWQDRIDGTFRLTTPFDDFKNQHLSFIFDKSLSTYTGHIEGSMKQERIEIDSTLSLDSEKEARLSLKTTFNGFEDQSVLLTHKSSPSIKSHAEVILNGDKYEADVSFENGNQLEGTVTVKTPLLGYEESKAYLVHSFSPSNLRSRAEVTYNRKVSAIDVAFTNDRKMEGSISITTPFKGYESTKMSFNSFLSKYRLAVHSELLYGDNKRIEADVSGNIRGKMEGRMALKTPFDSMQSTEILANHQWLRSGLRSHAEATYGNGQKITADATYTLRDTSVDANVAVQSPFTEDARATLSSSWDSTISAHSEFVYGADKIEADFSFDNNDPTAITAYLKTPFSGLETNSLTINKVGDWRSMNVKADLVYANSNTISTTVKNYMAESETDSSLQISSPFTEDISVRVKHTGTPLSFTNSFDASIGTDNSISQKTTLRVSGNIVDFSFSQTKTISGESHILVATLNHDGEIDNFKTETRLEYDNQPISLTVSLQTARKIEAALLLNTPFELAQDIQARVSHSGDINQFTTTGELKYNNMDKMEAKFDFFKYKLRRLNAVLDVKTPFSGYKRTKLSLKHNSNNNGLKSFVEAKYGKGQIVKASIRTLVDPREIELSLQSPFQGYEALSAKAKHTTSGQKFNSEVTLSKSQDQIAFTSQIDLDAVPMTAEARLTTPFSGFESNEISVSSNTDISDLKSAFEIKSSALKPAKADARIRFSSPTQLEGIFTATSGFKGFENAKVVVNNRYIRDEMTSHFETSWNSEDPIVLDATYSVGDDWNGHGGVTLKTPFDEIRSLAAKTSMESTSSTCKHSFTLEMNGNTLADMDGFVNFGDKYALTLNVREPKQLKLETETMLSDPRKSGSFEINWDTTRDDSQIKIETEYTNDNGKRNLMVKGSNTEKSVALRGSLDKSSHRTVNTMDLLVDGSSVFGYDFEDNSVRSRNNYQQGNSLKLRLPSRSVEVSGSYNNRYGAKSALAALAWDADRDDSKRFGIKANISPKGDATMADVSFEMPSIGKVSYTVSILIHLD